MKNRSKILVIIALLCLTAIMAVSCDSHFGESTPEHTHNLTKVDEVKATCTQSGVEAYYTCYDCNKLFADAEGSVEIEAPKVIEAKDHDYKKTIYPNSCTESGYTKYTCFDCGYTYNGDDVAASGHTFSAYLPNSAATCTSNATEIAKCDNCDVEDVRIVENSKLSHTYDQQNTQLEGALKSEADCENAAVYYYSCSCNEINNAENAETFTTGNALGHDEQSHAAQAPTCTEIGWDAYETCSRCDYTTYVEKSALDHDTVSHNAQAPTCTEIGWDAYETCSRCDYTTYVEKSALDHDTVSHNAQAPTCTAIGWDAYVTCSRCDYTTYVEKSALDHDTVSHNAQAPTCTAIGWDAYVTCSRCDYTTKVEKAALDHNYEWIVDSQPTYNTTGVKHEECTRCHDKRNENTEIPVKNCEHNFIKTPAIEATCLTAGNKEYYTCSICNKVYSNAEGTLETTAEESIIAALGHDEISHDAKAPTCTEGGYDAYVTCSRCDYTTYADKEALGHDEISHDAKSPTCTEGGYDAYVTCSRCDYTTYEEKAALGHDEISHDAKAPTCTEGGYDAYVTCSRCDYTTYADKEAIGHDEISHDAKASTCTEGGYDAYVTCSRCDYTTYNAVPEIGHDYKATVTAPTCEEQGYTTHVCQNDATHTYTDSYVDALGHNYGEWTVSVAPTYETDGSVSKKCGACSDVVTKNIGVISVDNGYTRVANGLVSTWQYVLDEQTFTFEIAEKLKTYIINVTENDPFLAMNGGSVVDGYTEDTLVVNKYDVEKAYYQNTQGAVFTITINASEATAVEFIVSVASGATTKAINEVFANLTVNGIAVDINTDEITTKNWSTSVDALLATISLVKGENVISFTRGTTTNFNIFGVKFNAPEYVENLALTHNFTVADNDPFCKENGTGSFGDSTWKSGNYGTYYENTKGQTFTTNIYVSKDTEVAFIIKSARSSGNVASTELFQNITIDGSSDGVVRLEGNVVAAGWGTPIDATVAILTLKAGIHQISFTRDNGTAANYNVFGVAFEAPADVAVKLVPKAHSFEVAGKNPFNNKINGCSATKPDGSELTVTTHTSYGQYYNRVADAVYTTTVTASEATKANIYIKVTGKTSSTNAADIFSSVKLTNANGETDLTEAYKASTVTFTNPASWSVSAGKDVLIITVDLTEGANTISFTHNDVGLNIYGIVFETEDNIELNLG